MSSVVETEQPAQSSAAGRAGGSSFYAAMRILPRPQREAMFEIYSFCRAVDDIADSDAPRAQRSEDLARWRTDIDAIYDGRPPPALAALARAVGDFGLRREDFLAVIDGMEMDAHENIVAPDWETLDLYCDRVASAVGRLSVRIFGMEPRAGDHLAHHLGRALQLTNILRDIDEDAEIGRVYLPCEALAQAGIATQNPAEVVTSPQIGVACAPVVERARRHFAEADRIMRAAPRRTVRAPRLMGAVYGVILERMIARGWALPRERVRIGKPELLWIVLRTALFR
jgi:presqualene diphosphate synthase